MKRETAGKLYFSFGRAALATPFRALLRGQNPRRLEKFSKQGRKGARTNGIEEVKQQIFNKSDRGGQPSGLVLGAEVKDYLQHHCTLA